MSDRNGKIELWFFRDLVDAQRMQLFRILGLPVDQLGSLGAQKLVINNVLNAEAQGLRAELEQTIMECFEVVSTTDVDQNGDHIERRVPKHHLMADRIAAIEAENRERSEYLVGVIEERERLRRALGEWQPIATCPFREVVDLWCIYGGEEYARYDGGASIGKLVPNRHRSEDYGFFGNQSNDGVPQRDARDLVPVAWRPAVQQCPAELIAEVCGIPLTLEDARSALEPNP